MSGNNIGLDKKKYSGHNRGAMVLDGNNVSILKNEKDQETQKNYYKEKQGVLAQKGQIIEKNLCLQI